MHHQTRLQLSFIMVILVFSGLLLVQMIFLNGLSFRIQEVVNNKFAIQESVNHAREAILTIRAEIWDILLNPSDDRAPAMTRLDALAKVFDLEERNLTRILPGEAARLGELALGFKAYYLFGKGILAAPAMDSFINLRAATSKFQEHQDVLIERLNGISELTRLDVAAASIGLQSQLQGMILLSGALPAAVVVLVLVFSFFLARRITHPLESLSKLARTAAAGDYTVRAVVVGDQEIASLSESFNQMLGKVEAYSAHLEDMVSERTHALAESNAELQASLETLKDTQSQLVNSEKMAAIGILVAGVAHEVNTPIGNSITASSYLINRLKILRTDFSSGELRKSGMEEFLDTSEELARMMASNLNRAGDLIASFKQVAVDQQSNERRRFDLRNYAGEIISSHHPLIKPTPHQILNLIDEDIEVDTHPGAIYQVLSNLIVNSLRHGFHGKKAGTITIKGQLLANQVVVDYQDDGRGIATDLQKKVFDPFFTTMRNHGGSGLGMYIAQTQAQNSLLGSLDLLDHPGPGVHFRLAFPSVLPAVTHA